MGTLETYLSGDILGSGGRGGTPLLLQLLAFSFHSRGIHQFATLRGVWLKTSGHGGPEAWLASVRENLSSLFP